MLTSGWKPNKWLILFIGFILQPYVFLYINKFRYFLTYFFLYLLMSVLGWYFRVSITWIFLIICPFHAYIIAKQYRGVYKRQWYSKWWGITSVVVLTLALAFLFRSFLYEPFQVPSQAMLPGTKPGSMIVVKKLGFNTYGTFGITLFNSNVTDKSKMVRGKVYAFYPLNSKTPFEKRLIGLPGDKIYINNHDVYVNDKKVSSELVSNSPSLEIYRETLDNNQYLVQYLKSAPNWSPIKQVVPENSYFFLGDNRDNSADSRIWGSISSDRIVGEVVYVFN